MIHLKTIAVSDSTNSNGPPKGQPILIPIQYRKSISNRMLHVDQQTRVALCNPNCHNYHHHDPMIIPLEITVRLGRTWMNREFARMSLSQNFLSQLLNFGYTHDHILKSVHPMRLDTRNLLLSMHNIKYVHSAELF